MLIQEKRRLSDLENFIHNIKSDTGTGSPASAFTEQKVLLECQFVINRDLCVIYASLFDVA